MPIKATLTWSPSRWLTVLNVLTPILVALTAFQMFGLTWPSIVMQIIAPLGALQLVVILRQRAEYYRKLSESVIEKSLEEALIQANPDVLDFSEYRKKVTGAAE